MKVTKVMILKNEYSSKNYPPILFRGISNDYKAYHSSNSLKISDDEINAIYDELKHKCLIDLIIRDHNEFIRAYERKAMNDTMSMRQKYKNRTGRTAYVLLPDFSSDLVQLVSVGAES